MTTMAAMAAMAAMVTTSTPTLAKRMLATTRKSGAKATRQVAGLSRCCGEAKAVKALCIF